MCAHHDRKNVDALGGKGIAGAILNALALRYHALLSRRYNVAPVGIHTCKCWESVCWILLINASEWRKARFIKATSHQPYQHDMHNSLAKPPTQLRILLSAEALYLLSFERWFFNSIWRVTCNYILIAAFDVC